jgi:hypothetical protein
VLLTHSLSPFGVKLESDLNSCLSNCVCMFSTKYRANYGLWRPLRCHLLQHYRSDQDWGRPRDTPLHFSFRSVCRSVPASNNSVLLFVIICSINPLFGGAISSHFVRYFYCISFSDKNITWNSECVKLGQLFVSV